MPSLAYTAPNNEQRIEIRSAIASWLFDQFATEGSPMSRLDRWSRRRIVEENHAKVELTLDAEDPVEYCYQNLIREIDSEAECGIYLVREGASTRALRKLMGELGISGTLYQQLPKIAPRLFPDELEHSSENLDIVWVTIEARYDRAHLDAQVSKLLIQLLIGDDDVGSDMVDALRVLLYAFHEDLARRLSELPLLLNEQATNDLVTMVAELSDRSGDYDERIRAIGERAGTC